MWKLLSHRTTTSPRTTAGHRIYVIGDVHGRADLLTKLLARIDADVATSQPSEVLEVFLGDYIDRGPHSREVLDILVSRNQLRQVICLKGNHETYVFDFLRKPAVLAEWKYLGGFETLLSYGVRPSINPGQHEAEELATAFEKALPDSHRQFLTGLTSSFSCGDYFFAHAGIRPGVPLSQQIERDLLWIREEFLQCKNSFGKIIVHGHTPVVEPDIRPNRINIDTGAYATGRLTCLVLQDTAVRFLETSQ